MLKGASNYVKLLKFIHFNVCGCGETEMSVSNAHVIENAEHVAEDHLTQADDDRHLHLVRVEPRYSVLSQLPNLAPYKHTVSEAYICDSGQKLQKHIARNTAYKVASRFI